MNTPTPPMPRWERPARAIVRCAEAVTRYRLALSMAGLVAVLLAGSGYLVLGSLDIQPLESRYRVRIELAQSGGLLPNQDVTLRGFRIGRVESVHAANGTVVAVAAIDAERKIPATGQVRVAALSPAGEQYLDFLPTTDSGPYLADGETISVNRTSTPVTMAAMLGDLSGTLAQVDPAKLAAIERELGSGAAAPAKLAAILDGGMFLISTLDSVLPQTVSLLHNSTMILTTLGDTSAGLDATAANLAKVLGGIDTKTGGFEQLVNRIPGTLATVDDLIADNSPTMVELLGNLVTVSQMAYLHVPALNEFFFPKQRGGSTLDAIGTGFHDGGVWALAGIYPRRACDYGVPRLPGPIPNFPAPYLNARCPDDPSLMPRGAANAPRPPGDNTAAAPPGSDRLATAGPTPTGPLSVPTPYGGSYSPSYIPPRK